MMRIFYFLLFISLAAFHAEAQNIGIGTSNPDYSLDINGDLGINDFIYHNNDGGTWFGFPGNDKWELVLDSRQMMFGDGGAKEIVVNQNSEDVDFIVVADGIEHLIHAKTDVNRVGIGKTNPNYLLEVNGDMGISDFILHSGNDNTKFGFPSNNTWEVIANNHKMLEADGGANELRVNPNNENVDFIVVADGIEHLMHARTDQFRLGIGTSSPDYLLQVAGGVGIEDFIYHNGDADSKFGFPTNDTWELNVANNRMIKADGAAKELIVNPGNDNVDFIILADGIEHLIKVDAYNKLVGIGTAAPTYFVDVDGDFRVIGDAIDHLLFADASTGRVGIGTANPTAALEVVGGAKIDQLRIGASAGTDFQAMQSGSITVSNDFSSGNGVLTSISFPNSFAGVPAIVTTPINLDGVTTDAFSVTVSSLSQSGAILNVKPIGNVSSTGIINIKINWMAWE